jgi:hypothetical protein
MWPLIQSDDQIADLVKSSKYQIDDIIVFKEESNLVAHRLIYKPLSGDSYLTKGDHNRLSDNLVHSSQILGKVISIRRGNKTHSLESLYKQQADNYLLALSQFQREATRAHLPYLLLKGIPIYKKYLQTYPRHFIYDADLLIHPSDVNKLLTVLSALSYTIPPIRPGSTEFSAFKYVGSLPLSLDLHLEPAVAFSQFPSLNALLPQIKDLTETLWKSSKSHRLTPNHQFIYLLLHALHHAYAGTTRWDLIDKLSRHSSIKPASCLRIIQDLKLTNLVYGALIFHARYYQPNPTTRTILMNLKPSLSAKLLAALVTALLRPWSHHHHYLNRLELLTYLFILSPLSFIKKITILLYSIISIDFKVLRNWAKSRLA